MEVTLLSRCSGVFYACRSAFKSTWDSALEGTVCKLKAQRRGLGVDIVAYHFRTGAGYQVAGLTKMYFMSLQLDQGLHGPIWLLGLLGE